MNEKVPAKIAWKSRVRVEALKSLDEFLNWHLGNETRSYLLRLPIVGVNYVYPQGWMGNFQELHGFFSPYQPLVGRVSGYQEDLDSTRCVLQAVIQNLSDKRLQSFAADEILAKVLAYRDLHLGEELLLPCCDQGKIELRSYKVDEVFNLWLGMPAYGLVPLDKGASLLLFRGTDFSLDAPRGWASLMSDVDLSGPGLHAFQKAQPKIHAWLKKCADSGSKARVMGYSLGGALAAYAYIFENEWIAEEGSCGFNLPGVSDLVIEQWNALCCKRQLGFVSFVNRGDVVSKVGKLFGEVYELSLDAPMKPMTAHTLLMCAQPFFDRNAVDVALENESRRVVSGTLQSDRAHAQSP
ncbi:MAG: hypothetical protein K2P51_08665 [Rhabdochlamydiaceae bacterium]|nr:hypothetical protein [Rhabdochlamydiaceae bacterium]